MALHEISSEQVNLEEENGASSPKRSMSIPDLAVPGVKQFHSPSQSKGHLLPEDTPLPACERLVVLIPDNDFPEFRFGKKIWSLASQDEKKKVLLVAQYADKESQSEIQRRLIYLASIMADPSLEINIQASKSRNWINTVANIIQPGDVIVSPEGLSIQTWNHAKIPLENKLAETFNVPVYAISGFCPCKTDQKARNVAIQIFYYLILIAIFVGGFVLEMDIGQTTTGWFRDVLLGMALIFEIVLIYSWNAVKG